jgi:transcriptional regulator GlxA family with amidase domain
VEIGKKAEATVSGGTSSMQTQRQVTETCGEVFATPNSGVESKSMRKARKKIEAKQVEDLALIGSTLAEMAMLLNCSEESLDRRFRKNIKRGMARRMILL